LKGLNVNYLLRKGLFCRKGIRVSYDIKRKREKENGGGQPAKRKKPPLSSKKPEIMFSSFFLINCLVDMQG
jgi:hypothetical protein